MNKSLRKTRKLSCLSPGCQRLFMRGLRFRSSLVSSAFWPNTCRPEADETKLPDAREKKPLAPKVSCLIQSHKICLFLSPFRRSFHRDTAMTDFPTLSYTSTSETPFLSSYNFSLKEVPLLGEASPYRTL